MNQLSTRVKNGEIRAVARAISLVENDDPQRETLIDELYPKGGHAIVWGLTGPPGSGKSSLLNLILRKQRAQNKKIAIIAVDPSSPFSGGAILGDRLRMQKHATDSGVYIRSMASRGHLGGIAGATSDVIKVLDAAGFDLIIIETIGVGQTEIDVVEISDLVFLVLVPGLGDEIQALKAGVMEIGDVFIVNKSDRDDAVKVRAELEYVLHMKEPGENMIANPIIMTSVLLNEGIDELLQEADTFLSAMRENGLLKERRKKRIIRELNLIIEAKVRRHVNKRLQLAGSITDWAELIYDKKVQPYAFINEKLKVLLD